MTNRFCDVASYQPSDKNFFQAMVNNGIKAVVVKVTQGSSDGDNYVNPKAKAQTENARSVGLRVHFYHYFKGVNEGDARNEARFFVQEVNKIGCDKNETVLVCDVEDNSLSKNKTLLTRYVNAFFDEVKKMGFPHVDAYLMSSWARDRLNTNDLIPKNIWIASYGLNSYVKPDNYWKTYKAWQFAADASFFGALYYNGFVCDTSYDYSGFYTEPLNEQKKNGEFNENGIWYYYIDGEKKKNDWQWIDKDKKTVYCTADGSYAYGEQSIDGHWYYFDKVTGAMAIGFTTLPDGRKVYYNEYGWLLYGWQDIDGKRYYFDRLNGDMMRSCKFENNGEFINL